MQLKYLGNIFALILVMLIFVLATSAENLDLKTTKQEYIKLNESMVIEKKILSQMELEELRARAMDISYWEKELNESVKNVTIQNIDFYIAAKNSEESMSPAMSEHFEMLGNPKEDYRSTASETPKENFTLMPVPPLPFPVPIPGPEDTDLIAHCVQVIVEHWDEITQTYIKSFETKCGDSVGLDHFPPVSR